MTGDPTISNAQFNMIAVSLYLALVMMGLIALLDCAIKAWRKRKQSDLYWRCYDKMYNIRRGNEWS